MEQPYFKYVKIELEQFAIIEENLSSNNEDVQFQTQAQFSYDKDQNVLCCRITVKMAKNKMSLLKAVMCSYFAINNDSIKQMLNEENHLVFVPHVLVQFASLNYGSLRGALYLKTQNTPLADYILPPVFFGQIIDKSFVVDY